jgi:hypothetical protein
MFIVITVVIIRTNWSINMRIVFCSTVYLLIILLCEVTEWDVKLEVKKVTAS